MLCVLEGAVIKTHEVAPWIERLARVGYVAKVLYGTIGALAALAAFSSGGRTTDTRGAMGTLLGADARCWRRSPSPPGLRALAARGRSARSGAT
jgi:hypothetical protein